MRLKGMLMASLTLLLLASLVLGAAAALSKSPHDLFGRCIQSRPTPCIAHIGCPRSQSSSTATSPCTVTGGVNSPLTTPTPATNPIEIENQHRGTTDWLPTNIAVYSTTDHRTVDIEGYPTSTSVAPGASISFAVSTTAPTYQAEVYRLGYYHGSGARLMLTVPNLPGAFQPLPSMDASTGLVQALWPISFTLPIPASWVTGIYLVKLTSSVGEQAYMTFVVRGTQTADIAFVHTVNTDNAYNEWGGASLYVDETGQLPAGRAYKVSFDRPFSEQFGSGNLFVFEYAMVRWLERNGYDLTYLSDVDLHEQPTSILSSKAVLVAGHSEYWSASMRSALQVAVLQGVSLGNFGGNDIYRQVRFEAGGSGTSSTPDRVLVCYKWPSNVDPLYGIDNPHVATEWRDDPVYNPEQILLGSMSQSWFTKTLPGASWVVTNASSFVFAGTGLSNGDSIPGIVGYEWDAFFPSVAHPPSVVVLSASPVIDHDGVSYVSNSTLYSSADRAWVFNAGTIWWSRGLDNFNAFDGHAPVASTQLQHITANILAALLTKQPYLTHPEYTRDLTARSCQLPQTSPVGRTL